MVSFVLYTSTPEYVEYLKTVITPANSTPNTSNMWPKLRCTTQLNITKKRGRERFVKTFWTLLSNVNVVFEGQSTW